MLEAGWVVDARLLAEGRTYCRSCAHLLGVARIAEQCTWCGAPMVAEESAGVEGWAYFADDIGELHPCCPDCLAGRFGITDKLRLRRET